MLDVALFFSILSSILFCIYLIMAIFNSNKKEENVITIKGQFTTRIIHEQPMRVINHEQ